MVQMRRTSHPASPSFSSSKNYFGNQVLTRLASSHYLNLRNSSSSARLCLRGRKPVPAKCPVLTGDCAKLRSDSRVCCCALVAGRCWGHLRGAGRSGRLGGRGERAAAGGDRAAVRDLHQVVHGGHVRHRHHVRQLRVAPGAELLSRSGSVWSGNSRESSVI